MPIVIATIKDTGAVEATGRLVSGGVAGWRGSRGRVSAVSVSVSRVYATVTVAESPAEKLMAMKPKDF